MNEELDQSDENQEPLEQSEGSRDQLIEIYKLQSQLADNISDRRTTIHKFYLLLMSGLALIFPTFFKLPTEVRGQVSIEFMLVSMALLGLPLSIVWFILINSNLRLNMLKYEALKRLENKLDYQFFKDEWELPGGHGEGKTYWAVSYIEVFIPLLFFLIFTLLLNGVSVYYPDKFYFTLLAYCPTVVVCFLSSYGGISWQIDRRIRGLEIWKKGKIFWVGFAIGIVYGMMIALFRLGYSEAINKEVGSVKESVTEIRTRETTKESVILPDGKEMESVNEKPAETDSGEVTKEQNGSQ